MLSRVGSAKRIAVLSVVAVFVAGCAHADKEVSIAPLAPAAGSRVDPGLGPGTRALSSGPGYKGSPSWSPGGDRIAFTVDGYVVDRPTDSEDLRHWTTRDFIAEDTEWISEDTLMILGAAPPSGTEETPNSLYRARADEDSQELEEVDKEVSALGPGRGGLIFALGRGAFESRLALTRGSGDIHRLYSQSIKGRVASLSLSPDGDEAVLAVRPPGDLGVASIRSSEGERARDNQAGRQPGDPRHAPVDGTVRLLRGRGEEYASRQRRLRATLRDLSCARGGRRAGTRPQCGRGLRSSEHPCLTRRRAIGRHRTPQPEFAHQPLRTGPLREGPDGRNDERGHGDKDRAGRPRVVARRRERRRNRPRHPIYGARGACSPRR